MRFVVKDRDSGQFNRQMSIKVLSNYVGEERRGRGDLEK